MKPSVILIVDDDPAIRRLLTELLSGRPEYKLLVAEDGKEAARLICGRPVDVVLTDIHMPGFSGLEVMADMRRLNYRPELIVMTANGTQENVEKARQVGARSVILKPFDDLGLIEREIERAAQVATEAKGAIDADLPDEEEEPPPPSAAPAMPEELESIFRVVSQLPSEGAGMEVPLVFLNTRDEHAVIAGLRDVALSLGRDLHIWSAARGIVLAGGTAAEEAAGNALRALDLIRDAAQPAVYLLTDFQRWLDDARITRRLKELVMEGVTARSTIVAIVARPDPPADLRSVSSVFDWPAMEQARASVLFEEVRAGLAARSGRSCQIDDQERGRLLERVADLPEGRARFEITAALMGKMGGSS